MARTKRPAVKGQVFTVEELRTMSNNHGPVQGGEQAEESRGLRNKWITSKRADKWDGTLVRAKEWVTRMKRYPKESSPDEVERSLGGWLRHNLPGGRMFRDQRWAKLNVTFGVNWQNDFSPSLGSGGAPPRGVIGVMRTAQWEGRFVDVKRFVRQMGRYPRMGSSNTVEASLARWLKNNLPGKQNGKIRFRPERWARLIDAFGPGWEKDFWPGFTSTTTVAASAGPS